MSDRTVVIGAGITGLTCARALVDAGRDVLVLDKGRGLGGRMATRRVGADIAFDHGAQYFRARSAEFRQVAEAAQADGALVDWPSANDGTAAWVGTPGMNALAKHLASDLDISLVTEVTAVGAHDAGWLLTHTRGTLEAAHLVSTVPVVQARTLLEHVSGIAKTLEPVEVNPCWALMVAFDGAVDLPDWQRPADSPLAWVARNSAKPDRPGAECWVAHATPAWSEQHLEDEKEDVAEHLLAAFGDLSPCLPTVRYLAAHRWRYATTRTPLGQPFIRTERLHVGGDWCLGARVEHGFASGRAIAADILETSS